MLLLQQTVRGLLHLLYPGICGLCGRLLAADESHFCPGCRAELSDDRAFQCPRCAATIGPFAHVADGCTACRDRRFRFEQVFRFGRYEGLLRTAILQMKHQAGEELAELIAEPFAAAIGPRLEGIPVEAVVPVPLHWSRRWSRGYNQSDILAHALAQQLRVSYQGRWLRRIRATPQQTSQAPSARWDNVRGAFSARPRADLAGKTVVLVDDVLTTGATCSEAARALREAGAARVLVAVLARSQG